MWLGLCIFEQINTTFVPMDNILKRRCADMTVLEVLQLAHLKNKVERPFIDMAAFCDVSGMNRSRVHKLLISDNSGVRELVWGGYDKYKKHNSGNKMYFDTGKVLEWLKNRE